MCKVKTEQEPDRRWIAEVCDLPGMLIYAPPREQAARKVQALSLRVLPERLDYGEGQRIAAPDWCPHRAASSIMPPNLRR